MRYITYSVTTTRVLTVELSYNACCVGHYLFYTKNRTWNNTCNYVICYSTFPGFDRTRHETTQTKK